MQSVLPSKPNFARNSAKTADACDFCTAMGKQGRSSCSAKGRLLGDGERTVEKVYGKHSPDYLRRAVNSLHLVRKKQEILQL